jgi:L-alanine-DL-glutamate epimerase-like enolase superfamily enzyme
MMGKSTDMRVTGVTLYFLPVETRVPLKFGPETLTSVTCARVCVRVADGQGNTAEGWGETPLSVQWVWPSGLTYGERHAALKVFSIKLTEAWAEFEMAGHPIEVGDAFQEQVLPDLLMIHNVERGYDAEPMPWLAALVCCSPFDIALHDAYGRLHQKPVYETYGPQYMGCDLGRFMEPVEDGAFSFAGKYPQDFLVATPPEQLYAWHLVGGLDPLERSELSGDEPDDGYPVLLSEWIERDGLKCLKVKLRGTDWDWDYDRLVRVGEIAVAGGVDWLSSDFNCTVTDPGYVNAILDRLLVEHPRIFGMLLYVEQPFPYDLESNRIDVRSVSARKPLFMDESAHDWQLVRLGRELGWTGVALKMCKTQTGALLALCWAKAHGMTLMVQDLTNPMLAQIPHVLLAAHAGTIMGVETNAMQFYPDASSPEEVVHPGLYRRQSGCVDLSTLSGPGFGYRLTEIDRKLPEPAATFDG